MPKMPQRKKKNHAAKTPPKPKADNVDELIEAVSHIAVKEKTNYSLDESVPWIRYESIIDGRNTITYEFNVKTLPRDYFLVDLTKDRMTLMVKFRCANFFSSKKRQLARFSRDGGFNKNTHANTSYQQVSTTIHDEHRPQAPDETGASSKKKIKDKDIELWSKPIKFKLPYKVEKKPKWEVQKFLNNLGTLTDECGGQQFHLTLAIGCMEEEKEEEANVGESVVVRHDVMDSDDNMEDADEEDDEEAGGEY